MLEKMFKLKENNTSFRTEVVAGLTTFMAMAYILAVNPNILSATGMNSDAILLATALASFVGCMAMALLANYPFALAPGMGLNAYMAFTVCGNMGYSWQIALLAVFVEGLIFIVLSLTNVREAIFNAIPMALKKGVSAGIGLFIAFIGLQGANLVVNDDSTLLTYVKFVGDFHTIGIGALLTLIGVSTKANMLDEEGKLPRIRPALLADAIATSVGAIFGTSTTTTYVESSAGVAAGGRTGLSAMVTGLLFLLAIVFAPIFTAIPSFATAPALIFVGFLMISSIISIDFEDITEAVPAYLAMLAMPLMYSISEGIALGVISYVVINLCCGKAKKIKPLMYILAVLFVLKYIFL